MTPKGVEDEEDKPAPIVVLKCDGCGDTYTSHVGATPICPSCGSTSANPASEPLL